jgi:hypothetical protein
MIIFPSAACWIALILLLINYKKHIIPLNEKIESLVHEKPPFFPPKSLVTIHQKIKMIDDTIRAIKEKSKAANDYIGMLNKNKEDPNVKSLIEKQKEYHNYFEAHYAEYCSLDLNMRFQFYITLVRDVIIAEKMIHNLNIKEFIDAIKAELKSRINFLTDNKNPDAGGGREFAEPQGSPNPPQGSPAGTDSWVWTLRRESMQAVEKKITHITSYLISAQSSETIAGISPIDEKRLLDIYKEGYDFETTLEHLKKLDDEHDRFTAEKELSDL